MTATTAKTANPAAYFQPAKLHWMLAIGIGQILWAWAIFSLDTFPATDLGPFGAFMKYMAINHSILFKIGFYGSWLIHVAEAFISFKIFEAKGITDPVAQLKWFVQTILFGFASFGPLLAYKPPKTK